MKRLFVSALAVTLGLGTAAAVLRTPSALAASKDHKVAICHGTASAKNPYVLIIVDESAKATHLDGHGQNNAPDFALENGNVLNDAQIAAIRDQGDGACACPPAGLNGS